MMRILSAAAVLCVGLVACGDLDDVEDLGPDLAGEIEGTYVGEIAGDHIAVDYEIDAVAIDNDTVEFSGPDFEAFEVDLMGTVDDIVAVDADGTNTLAYSADELEVVHNGESQQITFNGTRVD